MLSDIFFMLSQAKNKELWKIMKLCQVGTLGIAVVYGGSATDVGL